MIPEPTPCSGMDPPNGSVVVPLTIIRTTEGPALAAASMIADDSSIVTGWRAAACEAELLLLAPVAAGSRAPAPFRARTVPPAARIAERAEAATMLPGPARRAPVVARATGSV